MAVLFLTLWIGGDLLGGRDSKSLSVVTAPPSGAYFVRVDVILINRVRTVHTSYDAWGRPHRRASEVWWASFWEHGWFGWSDRGWRSLSHLRRLTQCSAGWCAEFRGGTNVVATDLIVIDSDHDVEMRWRRNYSPIKVP